MPDGIVLPFKKWKRLATLCDSLYPDGFCLPSVVVGPSRMLFPNSIVNARARLRANILIHSGPVLDNGCLGEGYAYVGAYARSASGIRVGGGLRIKHVEG